MLNFHHDRDLEESVITLSHEVAHNFNASHDDAFEDNAECYNKGFIMDELLNTTDSDQEGITCPVLYIEVTTIKDSVGYFINYHREHFLRDHP